VTWFLASLPTPILLLVLIGACCVGSIAGLLAVRARWSHTMLREHNDVAGFVFATLGVTYAVILAFVAIAVWEDFADTDHEVRQEAALVFSAYRSADGLPDPGRGELRAGIREYTRLVVEDEWPAMAQRRSSSRTTAALDGLWATMLRIEPRTPTEVNWHDHMLARMNDVTMARESRLIAVSQEVPPLIWIVLLLGGVTTLAYTYLYGVKNLVAQVIMTSAMAVMIGLALALVIALDHPFTGDTAVGVEAFDSILATMAP
jgi:hypothetical protein